MDKIANFAENTKYKRYAYTRKREFGNLSSIKDNYPKYVISMTPLVTKNDDNGITHLGLRTFLMMDEL